MPTDRQGLTVAPAAIRRLRERARKAVVVGVLAGVIAIGLGFQLLNARDGFVRLLAENASLVAVCALAFAALWSHASRNAQRQLDRGAHHEHI